MNTADYFVANTKPISYHRNHYKSVTVEGDWILLQPFELKDACPPDATDEERKEALRRELLEYGAQTLNDNRLLSTALTAIEDALNMQSLPISAPIMIELYPPLTQRLHKDDFGYNLTTLYLLFLCYRELIWEEDCLTSEQLSYISELNHFFDSPSRSDLCWEFISFVSCMFHDHSITVQMRIAPPDICEVQNADSLYYALLHQLLLHIAAGKEGLDGYHLAECQSCHQPFKKRHGNTKFCSLCGRNSERVRDYKRREKEAQHAKESNP